MTNRPNDLHNDVAEQCKISTSQLMGSNFLWIRMISTSAFDKLIAIGSNIDSKRHNEVHASSIGNFQSFDLAECVLWIASCIHNLMHKVSFHKDDSSWDQYAEQMNVDMFSWWLPSSLKGYPRRLRLPRLVMHRPNQTLLCLMITL